MKQLKFNPDGDLEKLRNYDFEYTYGDDWRIYFMNFYISRGDNDEFVINCDINNLGANQVEEMLNELSILEYNLIKANLLIMESDKDDKSESI